MVVIEKDATCTKYPTLTSNIFKVGRDNSILVVKHELKNRIPETTANDSIYIFTSRHILN
jgi:hypothetical protein